MVIMYRKYANGVWHAYFEGLEKFYGEGKTKREALQNLKEKLDLVILTIGQIQSAE